MGRRLVKVGEVVVEFLGEAGMQMAHDPSIVASDGQRPSHTGRRPERLICCSTFFNRPLLLDRELASTWDWCGSSAIASTTGVRLTVTHISKGRFAATARVSPDPLSPGRLLRLLVSVVESYDAHRIALGV